MTEKQLDKRLYTAHATATGGGRDGHVRTDDGRIDLDLALPPGLGGNGQGANPEQLFASGYAACFSSALQHVARVQKLKTGPVTVQANVSIGPVGGVFGLDVELVVTVPELAKEQAEALVRAAHEVCPYSNATRGNIPVALRVG
jgi:osmotically inducible protein OsmC